MTAAPQLLRSAVAAAVLTVAAGSPVAAAPTSALSGRSVQALAWFGGTAWAGTDEGLYRLGATGWTAVGQVPANRSVQALAVLGSTLVAGLDDGVIRSADGTVWSSAGLSGTSVLSLAASGGTLLAGTGHEGGSDGLALRSDDGGQTWAPATTVPATEGMPGAPVQAVLPAVAGDPALAGTAGSGVRQSSTGGGGWSDASTGLTSRWVTALWRDPAGAVLAGTDDGLDQSGAGGAAPWSAAAFPQSDPWIQALATAASGAPLAATYDGGVYQRAGAGWTALATGLPSVLSLLAIPPQQGGGVLAGTFDGAYCTGCAATLGAAPPSSARPGATPLPPVAARPGATSPAAAGSTPSAPPPSSSAVTSPSVPAVSGQNAKSGGTPPIVWAVAAALIAVSAGLVAWGRRRT